MYIEMLFKSIVTHSVMLLCMSINVFIGMQYSSAIARENIVYASCIALLKDKRALSAVSTWDH